ncbi:carbohydrate sulfotransferase 1-like [Amphiura filiformis]|uniref:carbohydrate sulfotransferase 1-like n=1 Tax=Amphiura filiformis TaxID=82378 RepID=UPI003B21B6DA
MRRHIKRTVHFLFFGSVAFSFIYVLLLLYTSGDIGPVDKLSKRHLSAVLPLRLIPPPSTSSSDTNTSVASNHSNSTISINQKITNDKKNVQLIIVTRWRSGSSFTGELFNNNPDFAYFFEPLIGTVGSRSGIKFGEHHMTVLHNLLKCNFTQTNYTWWQGQIPINCGKSLTFSKSILCEYFKVVLKPNNDTSAVVEEACQSRKHAAIKTVRVPDIGHLKPIVTDSNLNVKVIHLIRDPRAVYLSRASTRDVDEMYYNECDEMENNLRFWKDPPSWLRGRHMLLRYEDLADDPDSITEKIYDFLGLKVPATVKMWLKYNTNWNEVGEFSRTRVSNQAAHAWRTKIAYKTMLDVQRRCIVPIIMAGYKPITTRSDLMNLSKPSLTKYPYPLHPNISHIEDIWSTEEESVLADVDNNGTLEIQDDRRQIPHL